MSIELKEPKRKKRVLATLQQPFPILISSLSGISANNALWQLYSGTFNGDCVVVETPSEMAALHNMGFFGKGSLSQSAPEFGREKFGAPPFLKRRQWKQRMKWSEKLIEKVKVKTERAEVKEEADEDEEEESATKRIKVEDDDDETTKDHEENDESGKEQEGGENVEVKKEVFYEDGETEDPTQNETEGNEDEASNKVSEEANQQIKREENEDENAECSKNAAENVDENPRKRKNDEPSGSNEDAAQDSASQVQKSSDRKRIIESNSDVVVVLTDSDSEDEEFLSNLNPKIHRNKFRVTEGLHLTLEEAFFLSFGLGCLQVFDLVGNVLSLVKTWELFCETQNDFVQKYVAYHYFRSKGWVVKPGLKFGGDWLLYKRGPPFYHASYVVLVEVIDDNSQSRHSEVSVRTLSWTGLMGLNRVSEAAGKEVILCQVVWPSDVPFDDAKSPECLSKFTVQEVLVRRWISSQEREDHEKEEIE